MKQVLLTLTICLMALSNSYAFEKRFGLLDRPEARKGSRGVSIEEKVKNDRPAFVVRVDVDHSDRIYQKGDLMHVDVISEKSGYLYLFYHQADGSLLCLYPNKIQKNNRIEAHRKTVVPAEKHDFNLRIGAPYGKEKLIALVSLKPLKPEDFGTKSFIDRDATPIEEQGLLKAVNVELKSHPQKWAEHHVEITTVAQATQRPATKRLGLFIALSKYQDQRITPLPACLKDVHLVKDAMVKYGQLDGGIMLADEDATLGNIQKALLALKQVSSPNDEIFIYWTGHGARCADVNGDEADGDQLDEFLIPYDMDASTQATLQKTVLLDDTFGRWIQEFDGRKVAIIIDACHAGGQAQYTRDLTSAGPFDFFMDEAARTKDIGQKDAALLLSSQPAESSKIRRDGSMSVMTHFLIEKLMTASGVTLEDAYTYLKPRVLEYVKHEFPGSDPQTPLLVNEIGTIYLKP